MRDRLLNIAKTNGVSYQTIISRYIQERFLFRLSHSPYRSHFMLKGGALIYAFSGLEARPTLDIDFLGKDISREIERLTSVFSQICLIDYPADGVLFDAESIVAEELMLNKEYNGVRLRIGAKLDTIRETLSMDIGFGDVVYGGAINVDYPTLLDEDGIDILAYSKESVIAEKFEAMISLGILNSRMKDFYDVFRLLQFDAIDNDKLKASIEATFDQRHTQFTASHPLFDGTLMKDPSKTIQWKAYLRKIKATDKPDFAEVVKLIIERLSDLLPSK